MSSVKKGKPHIYFKDDYWRVSKKHRTYCRRPLMSIRWDAAYQRVYVLNGYDRP